jgi:PAS domain S-box-containing protein
VGGHWVRNYTLILVGITLFLVGAFLYLYVEGSHKRYIRHQESLMEQSTKGAASLIGLYIENAKRSVRLFSEEEGELIQFVAANPDNDELLRLLRYKVQRSFPDYFAFTVTDDAGNVLLDDFEGKVGQECRSEIHRFMTEKLQDVSVHPNPLGYHYDIMATWQTEEGDTGVFFISFRPQLLAGILSNSELHDHQLILVNRGVPGLIEITASGVRSELKRDIRLTGAEQARMGQVTDISGTRWTVVDLPAVDLFDRHRNTLRTQAVYAFLVFLVFSALMYLLIRREETRRTAAEQAVRESRDHLEGRVGERTRALSEANAQLELEIYERQRAEQALKHEISERVQTENALRTLHKIAAAQDQPFDARLRALLEHGCQQFKLSIGILSHIHGETYDVIQAVSPNDAIKAGTSLELGKTYCRETIKSDGPIGFEHAQGSEWRTHPCYREYNLEAYFGIRLIVGGEPYGTLNFFSPEPRDLCFTPTDEEVLRLMAQWVGREIDRRRAEEALKKSEESVRLVVESAPNAIVMADSTGRVTLVNSQTEKYFGYTRSELIGQPIEMLIPERYRQRHPQYRRSFATERRARAMGIGRDLSGRRKDGSEFPVEIGLSPIETEQGTLVLSAIVDISDRIRVSRELRRMRTYLKNIIDSMPSVLVGIYRKPFFARSRCTPSG